ncbi:MAG: endonuclease/exonuclease/phosphatase family protein [Aureispira sp.]|nr:endonuclease/exonuclease/phosphatase family protein [Aureispira sp.]
MKIVKKIIKWAFIFVLLFLLYVVIAIGHGTITDFQPEERIVLEAIKPNQNATIDKDELSFLNWNVGYGGLGKESNFFYDEGRFFTSGGKMVRASKENVEKNINGVGQFLDKHKTDFVLLQEVDQDSRRSYYIDQSKRYQSKLNGYTQSFAVNFNVSRVPLPVCEPWSVIGKVYSGLSSFSKYNSSESVRLQFPGEYSWPNRVFHLDRCMSVQRYPTIHPDGKELVVVNTHNSAYDGGELKQQEMGYFKDFVLEEYEKGNYVIVGGDWNQCPPNIPFDKNAAEWGIAPDSSYYTGNIAPGFMPADWTWAFDDKVPTNRKLVDTYEHKKTFVTLIDFYLVSPNVEVLEVRGEDMKFEFSDHQPVFLNAKLKGLIPEADTTAVAIDSTLMQ